MEEPEKATSLGGTALFQEILVDPPDTARLEREESKRQEPSEWSLKTMGMVNIRQS